VNRKVKECALCKVIIVEQFSPQYFTCNEDGSRVHVCSRCFAKNGEWLTSIAKRGGYLIAADSRLVEGDKEWTTLKE